MRENISEHAFLLRWVPPVPVRPKPNCSQWHVALKSSCFLWWDAVTPVLCFLLEWLYAVICLNPFVRAGTFTWLGLLAIVVADWSKCIPTQLLIPRSRPARSSIPFP
jgi:hypothetical protein